MPAPRDSADSLRAVTTVAPAPAALEAVSRLARFATRPLERFLRVEAASGIVLLVAAAVALGFANSPWADPWASLWQTPIGVRWGSFAFERSLGWWLNDGLMVVFFFVVGLEIRREVHHGELAHWRQAALPVGAALGGVVAPALLYLAFAGEGPMRAGWGVPMATDIAFAVGILALLGRRCPPALRVLLLALAVIDDLVAIVVIAVFYSDGFAPVGLLWAAAALGLLGTQRALGVSARLAYVPAAVLLWVGFYRAGVHPTLAGVVLGLLTPPQVCGDRAALLADVRGDLATLDPARLADLSGPALHRVVAHCNLVRREALSPAESLIELLHPWVAFAIMPLFALANAGVAVSGLSLDGPAATVALAVGVGLVAGKPLGIVLAVALLIRLRLGALPAGLTRRHVVLLGVVAGVGFTMALFVAQLAFGDAALLSAAKLGVLAGSGLAALAALLLGRWLLAPVVAAAAAKTADEAEAGDEV